MISKLRNNLGGTAFKLLGWKAYLKLIGQLLIQLPTIIRSRSLLPLDRAMTNGNFQIKHKLGTFRVDARSIDQQVQENSYAFGTIRELYIRDCYFRGHPDLRASEIKNVIDLGGNRGLFATMCTPFCQKLVIVEVQPQYNDTIHYNLKTINHFSHYQLINAFIGQAGKVEATHQLYMPFNELLLKSQMDVVDFLKIDIEGAEFSLFTEHIPLDRIRYISMEIHPQFGDVSGIINKLKQYHFAIQTTTDEFEHTDNPTKTGFLYARNTLLTL